MSNNLFEKQEFKKRVLFIGIPDMAYICLEGLQMSGVNIVGVMGAKKDHNTYSNFKEFVASKNLNFIEYDDLKDENFIQKIKDLNIDIAVVCSFNYKVPKVFLEAVKDGFVNVHPSLLPNYRGKNPYASVIVNDEKLTGVTLHFMDEGWDTGDIIVQHELPVTQRETMGTLFNRLNFLGLELLLKVLTFYEKSELPRAQQPQGKFVEGLDFSEDAVFINYNKSAEEIERFVRALNPFIIASTTFRSTFVKVFSALNIKQTEKLDYPVGTIVSIKDDKFYVTTQDGLIAPTVLQFGSFFMGSSKDFIDILNPKIGEKFE